MPDGAKCQTARNAKRRNDAQWALFCAAWHFAPFGIWRRSAFCAVRHFAPFGISRRSAFRAVRHFAPFGISRRSAFRAALRST